MGRIQKTRLRTLYFGISPSIQNTNSTHLMYSVGTRGLFNLIHSFRRRNVKQSFMIVVFGLLIFWSEVLRTKATGTVVRIIVMAFPHVRADQELHCTVNVWPLFS